MVRSLLLLAALAAAGARAEDPALERLLAEAAAASPELAQARAAIEADRVRGEVSGAFPDPTLSLGIQNDSFKQITIGVNEMSFWSVGITRPLPWPGKRGLRGAVAGLDEKRSAALASRAALEVESRVRRSWLGLQLARGEAELLAEQERLWLQAEHAARNRYEAGQAPQSDLLRAQLERARLQQRRWALEV